MRNFGSWLRGLSAAARLMIGVLAATAVLSVLLLNAVPLLTGAIASWDAFCATLIVLSWGVILNTPEGGLQRQAQRQDESRTGIFVLVLSAVCGSLVGILLLMRPLGAAPVQKELHRILSLGGIALSWILLHTVFTLHYAHLYYTDPDAAPDAQVGGLDFPGEQRPDYLDFAYFSFVIGMTFQVSDVTISARPIRRFVLLHGLLSFAFNTVVVALAISVLSGLGK